MSGQICIDANLVVKLYAYEDHREEAIALMDEADRVGIELIAPDFAYAEIASTLRTMVYKGVLSAENGAIAIGLLKRLNVKRYDVRDLYEDAWRIAERFNLGGLYDAYYLALAELQDCTFWTADERLLNSTPGLSYTRNIKAYTPGVLEG